jgi:hypothetical protein
MAKGNKTGGRTKGTPNKLTEAVTDLLNGLLAQGLQCDPIEFLARVVAGDKEFFGRKSAIPFGVRMKAASELAPYRASKRKAIEITGAGGASPVFIISDKKNDQTWEQRAKEIQAEQQRLLQEMAK